jgi:hypothetical protein
LQKSVVEEQADSLRVLIVVGGHGAFVAATRLPASTAPADFRPMTSYAVTQRRCRPVTMSHTP